MVAKRTMPDEQMKLIQECRASGLTDYDWCREHGIRPRTFYTWIYRMKKKGIIDIPATIATVVPREPKPTEIVKIQVEPKPLEAASIGSLEMPASPAPQNSVPVMEVTVEGVQLRVTNDIDPQMLAKTIQYLRGYGC